MTERLSAWPLWKRLGFRFVFVYWLLQIAPWGWLSRIPGLRDLNDPYFRLVDWSVRSTNARLFHVRETLVPTNGSGDTSWAWAQLWLYLCVALVAALLWSVLDRKRESYPRASYWLRTVVRYYLALFALSYGIIKVFALQMTFPSLSQLSTPLGDLLPMRFSWLFIGYSTPYQVMSGVMETLAGVLLLMRRTVTLGLVVATAAFTNVLLINLSYDVPVKLFALHLWLACVFLLVQDAARLWSFFVRNRAVEPTMLYEPPAVGTRVRYAQRALKLGLVVLFLFLPLQSSWRRAAARDRLVMPVPLASGVYAVRRWVVNGDTIPAHSVDASRWRDLVIDNETQGSVGSTDSLFWQRYRRGYFRYNADTVARTLAMWRTSMLQDSTHLFTARYELPADGVARLWTVMRGDSVYVELVRTARHFQLSERQFHWVSEYNR